MDSFKCEYCNKIFERSTPYKLRKNGEHRRHRFCSHQCRNKAMTGLTINGFKDNTGEQHDHYTGNVFCRDHVKVVLEARKGRPLPPKAEIHHIDGNKQNNNKNNLVICPNREYHKLLHRRAARLKEFGTIDMKRCHICKQAKPLHNFHKESCSWDGHYRACRECINKKKKERYRSHKL